MSNDTVEVASDATKADKSGNLGRLLCGTAQAMCDSKRYLAQHVQAEMSDVDEDLGRG
ncbi:hypothetical protein NOR_04862 [Metarhizium rileyi]|uniref:Uncharacterized protein n=1 Tax=Metarhizium rileyi (strain RCEF 4871) TaxID=1649241 RepID=A0A167DQT7_METRR|nr:hypothetical protein NOR_04862 [Metarhizium rileyi RCEF 4871]TWU77031.1 hypothetical protein ED733_007727 [Metarhizium rileyi]